MDCCRDASGTMVVSALEGLEKLVRKAKCSSWKPKGRARVYEQLTGNLGGGCCEWESSHGLVRGFLGGVKQNLILKKVTSMN